MGVRDGGGTATNCTYPRLPSRRCVRLWFACISSTPVCPPILRQAQSDNKLDQDDHLRRARQDQQAGRERTSPGAAGGQDHHCPATCTIGKARAWLERTRYPRPVPSSTAEASLTDPDSRLMRNKRGGYCQGCNLQIASARNQLLLAIEVHDNPADMTALVSMVNTT